MMVLKAFGWTGFHMMMVLPAVTYVQLVNLRRDLERDLLNSSSKELWINCFCAIREIALFRSNLTLLAIRKRLSH